MWAILYVKHPQLNDKSNSLSWRKLKEIKTIHFLRVLSSTQKWALNWMEKAMILEAIWHLHSSLHWKKKLSHLYLLTRYYESIQKLTLNIESVWLKYSPITRNPRVEFYFLVTQLFGSKWLNFFFSVTQTNASHLTLILLSRTAAMTKKKEMPSATLISATCVPTHD